LIKKTYYLHLKLVFRHIHWKVCKNIYYFCMYFIC